MLFFLGARGGEASNSTNATYRPSPYKLKFHPRYRIPEVNPGIDDDYFSMPAGTILPFPVSIPYL